MSFFSSILDRHDCQAADFNQDGLLDMFCSVGADRGTSLKCNGLFLQQPDGTFIDQAFQWNIGDATGRGRFCAVLDANNDGYPDVFYGTDPVRVDGLPSINRFYLNTGQGSFIDSPAMGLNLNTGAQSITGSGERAFPVDYNHSGLTSFLVLNGAVPSTGPIQLLTPQPSA